MIILEKPYVSEFLKQTLESFQIQVICNEFAENQLKGRKINFISTEESIQIFEEFENTPIYTNSENAIEWIEQNLSFTKLPEINRLFKNKLVFRDLIKPLFPDFFYKSVLFNDLSKIDVNHFKFPIVIKPAVGFFSLAVHKVENQDVWKDVLSKIQLEIETQKNVYPQIVLDISVFIIEQNIEGEEFAIDCYFNLAGKVVILSIMHHLFSSGNHVNDRIYTTSKKIIEENLIPFTYFLQQIGELAHLQNYPAHVEVRIDRTGKIIPIEINPMRFGGWCTTADLSWFAFGFNSYLAYQNQIEPNWNEIFKNKEHSNFSLIVLDNSTGIEPVKIKSFNFDKLNQYFKHILHLRKVEHQKYLVFGFVFVETSDEDSSELHHILHSDLSEFIAL